MANTVPILGYANTFGDWVVATNANSNEINIIGKSNWTKDSGQLILNGGPTGLLVGNNAIVQGQLQVTGTSSSAIIDNNLTVGGQVYLTNTTQSLAVSGPMFANGKLYATNTGVSLQVSNNTVMAGYLSVAGNTSIANTLTVSSYANLQSNLSVYGPTVLSNTITVSKDSTLQGNLTVGLGANVTGNIVAQNTVTVYGNTTVNFLQSNTTVNTAALSVVANTYSGNLIANSAVTTSSLYVANKSVLNGQANTNADLGVSGNVYVSTNATISGTTTMSGKANTGADLGIAGNVYVSTNATISGTTTMSGKANTTNDLGVGGNLYVTGKTTLSSQANTTLDLGVGDNLYVTGKTTLSGQANTEHDLGIADNLYVSGTTTLSGKANTTLDLGVGTNLYVTGTTLMSGKANTTLDLGVGSNLYVTGNATITGKANTSADLGVSGNVYVSTNATISGTTTLSGKANTLADLGVANNLYVTGNIASSNLISANGMYIFGTQNTQIYNGSGTAINPSAGLVIYNQPTNSTPIATALASQYGIYNAPNGNTVNQNANNTVIYGMVNDPYVTSSSNTTTGITSIYGTYNTLRRSLATDYGNSAGQMIGTTNIIGHTLGLPSSSRTATMIGTNNRLSTISGNVDTMIGTYETFLIGTNATTSANVTNLYGYSTGALTIGAASGNTSTLTNLYGLYLTAPTVAATGVITNRYGIYQNDAIANNYIGGTMYVANTAVFAGKANTQDIGVSGNLYLSSSSTLYVPKTLDMQTSTSSANIYSLSVGSGGLSVIGNFIINGTTVYNTKDFVISANAPITTGQFAKIGAFRTANGQTNGLAANSYIRWNEDNSRWDATANALGGNYYNLLWANDISDSLSSTSSTTIASSKAANLLNILAQSAFNAQNTTATNASAAFLQANAANTLATTANNAANTWLTFKSSGGTIGGDVGITGNLFVNGGTSYINVATFQTVDSLIELAANNLSDTVDIGFYGQYAASGTKYSGLARKAAGNYILFQGVSTNPTTNSIGTITADNYAVLNANIAAGFITVNNRMENYGVITNAGTTAGIMGGTSNGTFAVPTQTPNNTTLYSISSLGYTGSAWTSTASLNFVSTEATQAGSRGSKIVMTAIPVGGSTGYNLTWDGNNLNAAGTNLTGNLGTVTSVGGTGTVSGLSLSGTVTTAGNLTLGGTLSVSPSNFATQTANYVLAAPNGSTGTPTFRALVSADIPSLSYVSSVGNTAPILSSGGLSPTISISQAGTSSNGYLSSTDWTTFNNKQAALGTASASVSGILSSTDWTTFNNKQAALGTASASVSGILSSTDWSTFNGKQAALSTASASVSGILSSTDWTTFNSKQPAGSYVTSGGALGTPSSGTLTNCTFPTLNQNTTGTANSLSGSPTIAGVTTFSNTTNALSPSTGAIITSGGIGVAKNVYAGGDIIGQAFAGTGGTFSGTVTATGVNVSAPGTNGTLNLWGTSGTTYSSIYNAGTTTNQTINFSNLATGTLGYFDNSGNFTATQSVTAYSDKRLKTNIKKIDFALAKVQQLNGYTYDRTDIKDAGRQTGVIAQEVLEVLPEAVLGSEDTTYSVAYGNMVGLLVEAIKELKAEIEELKKGK